MADQNPNPNHRSLRLKVPPRAASPTTFVATPSTSRAYPQPYFPFPAATPTASATPSKHRLSGSSLSSSSSSRKSKGSLSFLFLLLFSLRSLYSLLPFLRSSPSFSLFPFTFLVSLLSFMLTYGFSVFSSLSSSSSSSSKDPFHQKQSQKIFSLSLISQSELRVLLGRSILLAIVFLLRFQALRYCGAAAMILAELSGNVTARFVTEGRDRNFIGERYGFLTSKVRGFIALALGLLLLSVSWDRIECFPFSSASVGKLGLLVIPRETCLRIWPMLLPFLSGFLGCYERVSMNWGTLKQLGKKRIRLISLFFTTLELFFPAAISMIVFESKVGSFSFGNLVWPLANTVVFGVLLAENFSDEKSISSKDFQREFLVTFGCTVILELFYFPELSLWGLLICGCLLYIAALELNSFCSSQVELGTELSEPLSDVIMKPIRHILSERKSRKIALFLMINTGYMVVEFIAGFMSNSLGLISDACHMLFDCAALAIGLYASYISRLPANSQFNYGRGRFEVLSGYVNAVFLVLVGSLIVLESLERILDPQEISTNSLLTVSIGGLLVNVIGLIFFHEEHHHAHGGSGSCSHSHSHSHSKISVSHENHHDHHHHHDDHSHSCQPDHGNRAHTHDNASHQIHHHHDSHNHDNHLHSHHHASHQIHDHRDHSCQHDHMNEPHGHDHESHQIHHRHGHHHHNHDSHDHSGQHDHGHPHSHGHASHQIHDHHDNHDHSCQHNHTNQPHSHDDTSRQIHHHNHDSHDHSCQHDHVHQPHSHNHNQGEEESKTHRDHHHHHHVDHNMEGIFLHVLADTLGSVGVVISTLVIKYKGWLAADPICSIFISVLIVSSVIPLLRNSAEVLLQRVPRAHERDLRKALIQMKKMKGVCGIQNLHVWSFTNTDIVGTLRLRINSESDKCSLKKTVSEVLREAGVKDLTLQVECVR